MGIEQRVRLPAIDYLKAASIVGVALIHAGRPFWHPKHGAWDLWLSGFLPQFAVPAFLFASGFLYQRPEPISRSDVAGRLRRVLVPYLVASAVVMVLGWSQPQKAQAMVETLAPALGGSPLALGAATAVVQILTGSALEIYYFIFLIVALIPTTFLLSRLSPPTLLLASGLLALAPMGLDAFFALGLKDWKPSGMDLFWAARNPFSGSLQMFLFGWVTAAFLPQITGWVDSRRRRILGSCAVLALLYALVVSFGDPWTPNLTIRFSFTLAVIAVVFICTKTASPGPFVRTLSDSSLAIYLYHFPFILLALPWLDSLPSAVRLILLALIALIGSITVIFMGRLVLGPRARTWLGA